MKRNAMKKVLSLVLSFGLLLSCATPMTAAEVQNDNQVQEVTDQKQAIGLSANELETQAVKLELNQTKTGVLSEVLEEDYYKFTITERGYFNLKFGIGANTIANNIKNGWNVEIYKESDLVNPIKKINGVKAEYEFSKLPMDKGNYYVKVTDNSRYYSPVGCEYTVAAMFTATNTWEVEDNNEKAKANVINANTVYSGNFYYEDDEDWYKVEVKDTGVIQLSLNIGDDTVVSKISNGWDVYVYDENYTQIKSYTGIKTDFTAQILPFSKGTYYIRVDANSRYYAPVDCTYELKLATIKSSYWESEYNDTKANADTIKVNKSYKGMLYHADDEDWYKVTTTKTGYFQIDFALDESVNTDKISNGWDIYVYDKNLNEIISYKGLKQSGIGGVLPYAKGTYYIRVDANSRYYAPVDSIYKLKVVEKASSAWESEGNDERKKADTISLEKTYKGLFLNATDQDWFKFTTKATGTVKLTFKLADSDAADSVSNGWDVYIYKSSSNNVVKELKGVKSKGSVTVDLKKGTYYVKVVANSKYYAPVQCTYSLTVNYSKTPGKVTLSTVTAGKKQATLKWKKVKDADGYIVYRSTSKNGTYKKVKTITKNSTVKYVDKKLKSGKKYYYKVVAYNKTKYVTANAAASKVKSVKVK